MELKPTINIDVCMLLNEMLTSLEANEVETLKDQAITLFAILDDPENYE